MAQITLQVPDGLLDGQFRTPEELGREIRLAAALHWFESGRVSEESAAELAAMPRPEFRKAVTGDVATGFLVDLDG